MVVFFVVVGVLARIVRYLVDLPQQEFEVDIAENLIQLSYLGLARGVVNFQAAPVLWLWIEKAIADLFGMNAYALRVFPLLASIASLLLFCRLMKYTTMESR